jgi:hypothetical protein
MYLLGFNTLYSLSAASLPAGLSAPQMIAEDTVTGMDLKTTAMTRMGECAAHLGQQQFAQLMATVDPSTQQTIQAAPTQSDVAASAAGAP